MAWNPTKRLSPTGWRQGMTGGAKAHYDGVVAFSQTDFTEDLESSRLQGISSWHAHHSRRCHQRYLLEFIES